MRTLKTKIGLLLVALAFVFVGALSLSPAEVVRADVDTSSGFAMLNGAAVKATTDGTKGFKGISWVTSVSSAFYTANGFDGSERFGAVIAPTGSFEGELTKDTVLSSGEVLMLELNHTLNASTEDKTYRSVVDFSAVESENLTAAYKMELTARAYVKVGTEYFYAPTNGSSRSARQVAAAAENEGELEEMEHSEDATTRANAAYIRNFYLQGTGTTSITTKNAVIGASGVEVIDLSGNLAAGKTIRIDMPEGNPTASSTEVCIGAQKIAGATYNAETKIVTLPSLSGYTLTAGETYITIFADGVIYRSPIIVATKVFTEMSDFEMFSKIRKNFTGKGKVQPTVVAGNASDYVYDGYYVLGNDINASSYVRPTEGYCTAGWATFETFAGTNLGLTGTFNGMGHTINGLKYAGSVSTGLFELINGGTVKNLALTNLSTTDEGTYIGVLAYGAIDATIENVYIQANSLAAQYQYSVAYKIHQTATGKTTLKNIFLDVTYRAMEGKNNIRAGICDHASFDSGTGNTLATLGTGQRGANLQNTINVSSIFAISNLGGLYYYQNNGPKYYACGYGDNQAADVVGDTDGIMYEETATHMGTKYVVPSFVTTYVSGSSANTGSTPDLYYAGAVCYQTQAQFEEAASSLDFSSLVSGGCWSLDGSGLPVWTGDVVFSINDGETEEVTLNSVDSNTEMPFVVSIKKSGATITPTSISMTSGGTYATWDSVNNKIVSNGYYGEAILTIAYTVNETAFTKAVPVHVLPVMREYDGTITNFSAIHGDAKTGTTLAEAFGAGFTSAKDSDGTDLTVTHTQETVEEVLVDYYKIYDVPMSKTGITEKTITLYNASYGMYVPISGYTGVFTEIADFEFFQGVKKNIKSNQVHYGLVSDLESEGVTAATTKYDGYYVLANDINASGYTAFSTTVSSEYKWHSSMNAFATRGLGLTGTFDGQHHKITTLTFGESDYTGLFALINGGTVKNLALTGVVSANTSTHIGVLAYYGINAHVEDVYIDFGSTFWRPNYYRYGLFEEMYQSAEGGLTLNRVYVNGAYAGYSKDVTWSVGDICYEVNSASVGNFVWTNVVTISGVGFSIKVTKTTKVVNSYMYGLNESFDSSNPPTIPTIIAGADWSATVFRQLPAYHYADIAAFKAALTAANPDIDYNEWTATGKWAVNGTKGIYWAA